MVLFVVFLILIFIFIYRYIVKESRNPFIKFPFYRDLRFYWNRFLIAIWEIFLTLNFFTKNRFLKLEKEKFDFWSKKRIFSYFSSFWGILFIFDIFRNSYDPKFYKPEQIFLNLQYPHHWLGHGGKRW